MIRVALGGIAALTGLFLVWQWLLRDAVPQALAPVARVSTHELEELRDLASEPVARARQAVRVVEERLEEPEPLLESAPRPEATSSAGAASEPRPERDRGADAALIRRMLAVYARTVSPE